ncbi:hypothetical protein FGO68_gene17645 [Halteria grandinella]|uniref:Uncharacterized protein n=1 Tax=Halteria grandinella TaxID=5974 RepID=A0A8J8NT85_HALGN|nr:hypothetical protein FGO68_gene17645 [Halteria grandinella]
MGDLKFLSIPFQRTDSDVIDQVSNFHSIILAKASFPLNKELEEQDAGTLNNIFCKNQHILSQIKDKLKTLIISGCSLTGQMNIQFAEIYSNIQTLTISDTIFLERAKFSPFKRLKELLILNCSHHKQFFDDASYQKSVHSGVTFDLLRNLLSFNQSMSIMTNPLQQSLQLLEIDISFGDSLKYNEPWWLCTSIQCCILRDYVTFFTFHTIHKLIYSTHKFTCSLPPIELKICKFSEYDPSISNYEHKETETLMRELAEVRGLKVTKYEEIVTKTMKSNIVFRIRLLENAGREMNLQIDGSRNYSFIDISQPL